MLAFQYFEVRTHREKETFNNLDEKENILENNNHCKFISRKMKNTPDPNPSGFEIHYKKKETNKQNKKKENAK